MIEAILTQVVASTSGVSGPAHMPPSGSLATWTQVATCVGTICAIVAAGGVYLVWRQLKLAAWANAQEIFTEPDFVDARTEIQQHFEDETPSCPAEATDQALLVCRKMDQLCCLVVEDMIKEEKLFQYWARPIGKCWIVIEQRWRMISKAREHDKHPTKWAAFLTVGERAASQLKPRS